MPKTKSEPQPSDSASQQVQSKPCAEAKAEPPPAGGPPSDPCLPLPEECNPLTPAEATFRQKLVDELTKIGKLEEIPEIYVVRFARHALRNPDPKKHQSVEKQMERIVRHIDYKKLYTPLDLKEVDLGGKNYEPPVQLYCYGTDKVGRAVLYWTFPKLSKTSFKTFDAKICASLIQRCMEAHNNKFATKFKTDRNCTYRPYRMTHVMDIGKALSYFGPMNAKSSYSFFKKVMKLVERLEPDGNAKGILINTGRIGLAAWKILKQFADPFVADQAEVVGTDYLSTLLEYIPIEEIPECYGGKGKNKPVMFDFCSSGSKEKTPGRTTE